MSKALGVAGAMTLLKQKQDQRVMQRADQLRDITVQLHREAPRGGSYLNRYGQPRSAPGEPPASETGQLMNILDNPPTPVQGGYSVTVNYRPLEFGTMHVAARPMGRMAVALLKQKAQADG